MTDFERQMREYLPEFKATLSDDIGDWIVKGFIDTYHNVYTISVDTKVVSKLIELMLFPIFSDFARQHCYELHLAEHQNYYPDITFISRDGEKIALDLKSTYRVSAARVSGFTLGHLPVIFAKGVLQKTLRFLIENTVITTC